MATIDEVLVVLNNVLDAMATRPDGGDWGEPADYSLLVRQDQPGGAGQFKVEDLPLAANRYVARIAGDIEARTFAEVRTDLGIGEAETPTLAGLNLGTGELTCGSINRAAGSLTLEIGGVAQVTITDSTVTYAGDVHITGTTTYDSNIIIPDDGWIGSVTTNQAVQIASTGNVTMPGTLNVTGDLAVTGNISLTVNNGSVGYTDNSPMLVFNNTDDRVELTGAAGLAFTAASGVITQDTADGSDSGVIQFCGGGVVGNTRGGYCNLFGNEHISAPGCVEFVAGNVTGGHVKFYTGNNLERVRIDKDGLISLYGNLVIPDAGYIGSVGDTDAIQIDASGNTTFSVFPITPSAEPDADYEVANKKYVDDHAGVASTWIGLTDTDPANYTGEAGNCVVVNAGEDGLEFGAAPGGGAADGAGGGKLLLGWFYDSITQGTWESGLSTLYLWGGYFLNSTSADGDELHFSIYLGAGTYTLKMMASKSTDYGVSDIYIDAAEVASFDWYRSPILRNQVQTQTSIVVASSGVKDIKVVVDGKNGSSSSYGLVFQALIFYRTA